MRSSSSRLHVSTRPLSLFRVSAAPAGRSAPPVPWRVNSSGRPASWCLWVSRTWWTAPGPRATRAAAAAWWTRPSSTSPTTRAWTPRTPTRTRGRCVARGTEHKVHGSKDLLLICSFPREVMNLLFCVVTKTSGSPCSPRTTSPVPMTPSTTRPTTPASWTSPAARSTLWWRPWRLLVPCLWPLTPDTSPSSSTNQVSP